MRKIILIVTSFLCLCIGVHAQTVNPFTGDLTYNIPLFEVPSSKGPSIPISLSYNAGIMMEQQASSIGLGWGYSGGGEISRVINNIPDDWKRITTDDEQGNYQPHYDHYGVIHFKDAQEQTNDIYRSSFRLDSLEFVHPAYDFYRVNSLGISGSMQPYLFEYATLMDKNFYGEGLSAPDSTYKYFTQRPEFRFIGEANGYIETKNFNEEFSSLSFKRPTDNNEYIGGYYDSVTNRLSSIKYIEYFTNHEINDDSVENFITFPGDPAISGNRNSWDYDLDGIGGFRVTDESGTVYHFMQPVYTSLRSTITHKLTNNYQVNNTQASLTVDKDPKFATSWKLVAITGIDYQDVNNNNIVDIEDKGYWVSFDYKLWTRKHKTRTPNYGMNYAFVAKEDHNPQDDKAAASNDYESGKLGVYSYIQNEIYYLNKITTNTHTAIFIRDIREDAHGTLENGDGVPLLKLDRIMLYNNSDLDKLPNLTNITTSIDTFDISYSNTPGFNKIFNTHWYDVNSDSLNQLSLKSAFLSTDYSLARKFHNNVNTTVPNIINTMSQSDVMDSAYTNDYTQSGKLTLNEIKLYGLEGLQTSPSVKFDYNHNSSADNPDYNPVAVDYWGFYKSDASTTNYSSYRTTTSSQYVDAWSLRSITTPAGGTVSIKYDSDDYQQVLAEDENSVYIGVTRTYAILSANIIDTIDGAKWLIELEDHSKLESKIVHAYFNDGLNLETFIPFVDIYDYVHFVSEGNCTPIPTYYMGEFAGFNEIVGLSTQIPDDWEYNDLNGNNSNFYKYTGNGYIKIQYPVGDKFYGGDIKVKEITTEDELGHTYTTQYNYTEGVATAEADRFENPESYYSEYFEDNVPMNLVGNKNDPHSPSPRLGYSECTIKKIGDDGSKNGKTTYSFITSDEGVSRFEVDTSIIESGNVFTHICCGCGMDGGSCDGKLINYVPIKSIVKYTDEFSSRWGLMRERVI